jgi:hypothetical protein
MKAECVERNEGALASVVPTAGEGPFCVVRRGDPLCAHKDRPRPSAERRMWTTLYPVSVDNVHNVKKAWPRLMAAVNSYSVKNGISFSQPPVDNGDIVGVLSQMQRQSLLIRPLACG